MKNILFKDVMISGVMLGMRDNEADDFETDIVPNNAGFLKSLFPEFGNEVEETEDLIRIPVKSGDREDVRLDTFSEKDGIYFIRTKKKEDESPVLDFLFDADKWKSDKAAAWVKEHKPQSGGIAFMKAYGDPAESKFYTGRAGDYDAKADDPDEEVWIFEGFSSTNDLDRQNEIVDPKAFKKYLKRYMTNPIVLLLHRWGELPIGRVLEAEIQDKGLWVRMMISKTAPDIWKLIKEKILRAMSIGFDLHEWKDAEGKPRLLTLIELLENSLVNVPANPFALGQAAKSLGINIENLKSLISKQEEQMNPFQIKLYKEGDGGGGGESIDVEELVKVTVRESLKGITDQLVEAHNRSASEFSEKLAKSQDDFFERQKERDADILKKTAIAGTGVLNPADINPASILKDIKIRDDNELYVKVLNKTLPGLGDRESRMIEEFKELNDNFYTAWWIGKTFAPGLDIKNHPDYGAYRAMKAELFKAMDTETATEGLEWVGTGYSSQLYQKVMLQLKVAGLFETIPMPFPSFYLPTDMVEDVGYLIPQSISDISSKIRVIDPTTAQVLLSAIKFGARIISSTELIEDAVFAILPLFQRKIIRALAKAIETSVINGDITATHRDSDVTESYDAQKAYPGLRKLANAKSAETDLSTFNADTARAMRGSMGEYGVDPANLVWLTGLKLYIKMLSLRDAQNNQVLTTLDKWGPQATFKTGTLGVFDGAPVIVSAHCKENLNATGVVDGVTETYANLILVNTLGFVCGERRIVKVGQKEDIETDQQIVVATQRRAFVELAASGLYPIWVGYKITP